MVLKNFLTGLVFLFYAQVTINAQIFSSLPKDSTIWHTLNRSPKWPDNYSGLYDKSTAYLLLGDTTISAKSYKKLYRAKVFSETQTLILYQKYAFFRYATNKVYMRYFDFNSYQDTSEFLLYDFDLSVGDKFIFRYSDTLHSKDSKILRILKKDTATVYEVNVTSGNQLNNFTINPSVGGAKMIKMHCPSLAYLNSNFLKWPARYKIGMEDSLDYLCFLTGIGAPGGLLYPEITADNILDTLSSATCMYQLNSGSQTSPLMYRANKIITDYHKPDHTGKTLCAAFPYIKFFWTDIQDVEFFKYISFENPIRQSNFQMSLSPEGQAKIQEVCIVDQYGRQLHRSNNLNATHNHMIDFSSWSNGIYYLKIVDKNLNMRLLPLLYQPE